MTNCVVSGGSIANYFGSTAAMAGVGDISYISGGSCVTTVRITPAVYDLYYKPKDDKPNELRKGLVVSNSTQTSNVYVNVTLDYTLA